jgi:hydrogenase expression/formation protein HypE
MLGLDPLSVANEGKLLAVVAAEDAEAALAALRAHPLGTQSSLVGRFTESRDGLCEMITEVGGRRILQKPYGEELPRIC